MLPDIPGDDWELLVPAGRVQELRAEVELRRMEAEEIRDTLMGGFLIDEPGASDEVDGTPLTAMVKEAVVAHSRLQTQVGHLEADKKELQKERCELFKRFVELEAASIKRAREVQRLTEENAKLNSGEAWVGEEYTQMKSWMISTGGSVQTASICNW